MVAPGDARASAGRRLRATTKKHDALSNTDARIGERSGRQQNALKPLEAA